MFDHLKRKYRLAGFNDLPIKQKLLALMTTALFLSMLISAICMLFLGYLDQKKRIYNEMMILEEITSSRSAASVMFVDKTAALQNLSALATNPRVIYACLYSKVTQERVAEYKHDSIKNTSDYICYQPFRQKYVEDGRLAYSQTPIIIRNNEVGFLYLVIDRKELHQQIITYSFIIFLSLLFSALVAFRLTLKWQHQIYDPIAHLAATARSVSMERDWGIRAVRETNDELGDAVDAFNTMLEQLETDKLELEALAYFDTLTGLPNRRMFTDRLEKTLALAKRKQMLIGLMFIDLDKFKDINDTLGHDIGDELLIGIAKRLNQQVRHSDTAARIGGDEFTVILADINCQEDVEIIAQRMLHNLRRPMTIKQQLIHPGASIGIALTYGEMDVTELMKQADIALYRVKERGRNGYHIHAGN